MRFTSTTTSGGKAGWSPASRFLIEARQAVLEEPLAPLADDLPRGIETGGDELVRERLGREQDQFGADDVTVR
jgi:hypothetical protein